MHYAFDDFMTKQYPYINWVRYADDGVLNCVSQKQAKYIIDILRKRLKLFGLELNLDKTKIVYCKEIGREDKYDNISFDFLGYTFRPREAIDKNGNVFTGFLPAISNKAKKAIKKEVRGWKLQHKTGLTIQEIAETYNSKIQGWINYYSHYCKSEMRYVLNYINLCLVKWVRHKYKNIKSMKRARNWIKKVYYKNPKMFAHWKFGVIMAG